MHLNQRNEILDLSDGEIGAIAGGQSAYAQAALFWAGVSAVGWATANPEIGIAAGLMSAYDSYESSN